MKYYAVKVGKNPGIYKTWDECAQNVLGFEGAKFKSFPSLDMANEYLNELNSRVEAVNVPEFYIDGSYNVKTNEYSFGGVLLLNGCCYSFKKKYSADEFSQFRNVSGEIKGSAYVINYAINKGYKEINLYYDYQGIENWYIGKWNANNELTIKYKEFANDAKNKIKVNFHKIKSHTNNLYNDMADRLAKEALGIDN